MIGSLRARVKVAPVMERVGAAGVAVALADGHPQHPAPGHGGDGDGKRRLVDRVGDEPRWTKATLLLYASSATKRSESAA